MPLRRGVRVDWNGDEVRRAVQDAAERGVRLAGEHVLGESRKQVPIETGALERSGSVDMAGGDEATAYVSYDTPYAVRTPA